MALLAILATTSVGYSTENYSSGVAESRDHAAQLDERDSLEAEEASVMAAPFAQPASRTPAADQQFANTPPTLIFRCLAGTFLLTASSALVTRRKTAVSASELSAA